MLCKCAAPKCEKTVEISVLKFLTNCVYSSLHGGSFTSPVFCPEHKERITSGSFNDGNASTNPDLSKQ